MTVMTHSEVIGTYLSTGQYKMQRPISVKIAGKIHANKWYAFRYEGFFFNASHISNE